VEDCNRAQAVELIRALHWQLREMTVHLAWFEQQDVTASNGRACEMGMDEATLRRDIEEAHALIDRLQRRYLGSSVLALAPLLAADSVVFPA
jgi:hypothetical protein